MAEPKGRIGRKKLLLLARPKIWQAVFYYTTKTDQMFHYTKMGENACNVLPRQFCFILYKQPGINHTPVRAN